jgi:hypothetical protein
MYMFISTYNLMPYFPCHYLYISCFLHLLSTNDKCTQSCYFPLLLKPTAQKEKRLEFFDEEF